jgi:hypothetical protein
MAKNPYKPTHLMKARMIPISEPTREGARLCVTQLEQKGEPGKERKEIGSQKELPKSVRSESNKQRRNRVQDSLP